MKPAGSDAPQRAIVADFDHKAVKPHATASQLKSAAPHADAALSPQISLAQLRRQAIDHHRAGRIDQALKLYRAVLALRPDDAGIWCNLGAVLRKQKYYQSAVNCYRRALQIKPGDAAALGNLANALKDLQRLDESLAVHRQVVAQKSDDVQTLMNYACALREDGQFAQALEQLDRAQTMEPAGGAQAAGIEWERAQNLLYLGRYREGWRAYEARWHTGELPLQDFGCAQWRGEAIEGQTILLHSEQGYGDTILAARFIPMVKQRIGVGGRVILQCKPELHRLFATVGADLLITPDQAIPAIDLHCPLMSLMGALDIGPDTIPAPARLHVPDQSRQKLAALRAVPQLKIGIVWSGSITFKNNENRALPLSAFLPLAEIANVRLYSLQKGPRQIELQETAADFYIEDLGSRCDDFADTAAAIEQLDLIVMSDSSVAHLAASLNKPVINLLQKVPYWLYALEAETTPWYPSMQLLKQKQSGVWQPVLDEAAKRIESMTLSRFSENNQ